MSAILIALMRFTCKDRKIGKEIKSHLIVCSKHVEIVPCKEKFQVGKMAHWKTINSAAGHCDTSIQNFWLNCCFNVEGMETSGCRLSWKINALGVIEWETWNSWKCNTLHQIPVYWYIKKKEDKTFNEIVNLIDMKS